MHRSERLNQELIFLSYRNHFHLQDLMQEFQISKRTALRDVTSLEQLGLAFYVDPGRYGGYRLVKQQLWVPVLLNIQEINALFFALKALRRLSATPFEKSYHAIYQKLLATLPLAEQQKVAKMQAVVHYYDTPNLDGPRFLSALLTAILNEAVLRLDLQGQGAPLLFQAYDLLYRHGIWFVSGLDRTHQRWRIIRCDRVTAVTPATAPAALPRPKLAEAQQADAQQQHNIQFRCELTPLGRELVLKNRYPHMQLEQIAGQDYLTGGYGPEEFDYMVQYLLSLGTNVKILAPTALKEGYLAAVRQILNAYS